MSIIQSPDNNTANADYDEKKNQPVGYESGAGTPGRSTDGDRKTSTNETEDGRSKSGQDSGRSGGSMGNDSTSRR